ncbi:hypothetical protein N177_0661 [Lutibaculum baratangense AMV1]|uniref:Uncharacterized protein n=1 Tax=Lutibaculum baratangense AMV1 TaxID=631454 RepID=V4R4M7_9HYPH|nr:hypothetical protein N177_0661 [Lutibaculum baratangense AMV1]
MQAVEQRDGALRSARRMLLSFVAELERNWGLSMALMLGAFIVLSVL